MKSHFPIIFIFSFIILFTGCDTGPQPIHFGKDTCAFCKMTIMDPKFGAEIITVKGKVYKYDDVNCLVHHLIENKTNPADIKSYYILNWMKPGSLIDAVSANYIFSEDLKTPMASNIAAISDATSADSLITQWNGQKMGWNDILNYFINN